MTNLLIVFEQHPAVFIGAALVVGLLFGSFLNVVILRLPPRLEYFWKKEYAEFTETAFSETPPPGLIKKPSHCPQCKKRLAAWHNIPLLSYLFLRGRCAFCKQPISARYPVVELLTGVLTAALAFQYGVTLQLAAAVLLLWFLMVITWIDIDTYLIPDQLSLSLLWMGLFFSLFDFSITPSESIVGGLIGYLSLWLVFHLFKLLTKKEGMGYGDFKLLAAGGAWLGPEMLIGVLFIASITGLLFAVIQMALKKGQQKIPFGPYLSVGILVCYVFNSQIQSILLPN